VIDFAADLAHILGGPLAKDAVLTPRGGAEISIRVVPRGGDFAVDLGLAQAMVGRLILTTSSAGLARPRSGDAVTIGAVNYEIITDAMSDPRGLTWVFDVRQL